MHDTLLIEKYFPALSADQLAQLRTYADLLLEWNSKINLISRKDEAHVVERHILHSMAIGYRYRFKPGTKILDGGTGGGFPGIPLAIMFPECRFTLVDGTRKKIDAVREMANQLGLKNVTVYHARMEELQDQYNFVVSRAVAPLEKLVSWCSKRIVKKKGGGMICLKGGDLVEELSAVNRKVQQTCIGDWFAEPYFERKYLLFISF